MRRPARGLHRIYKSFQPRIIIQAAIGNRQINPPQIHRHHPTSADIHMPNLGIAHLPNRQTNIKTAGDQRRVGAFRHQPVISRRLRQRDGVVFSGIPQAPAVKNTQNNGLGLGHFTVHHRGHN